MTPLDTGPCSQVTLSISTPLTRSLCNELSFPSGPSNVSSSKSSDVSSAAEFDGTEFPRSAGGGTSGCSAPDCCRCSWFWSLRNLCNLWMLSFVTIRRQNPIPQILRIRPPALPAHLCLRSSNRSRMNHIPNPRRNPNPDSAHLDTAHLERFKFLG